MRPLASGLLALSLLVTGAPTEAQEGQRGWIGISYETRSTRDGAARVVITEVRRGSPAESAGVRPGDRLVAIEAYSSADDLMNLSRRLTLRPGQLIEMRIERDGRPRDLHLRAAERPFASYTDAAIAVSIQADSLVETMFRAMDSLRIHITEANGRSDRTVRTVSRSLESAAQARAATARSREAVSAPFEFFVFRGAGLSVRESGVAGAGKHGPPWTVRCPYRVWPASWNPAPELVCFRHYSGHLVQITNMPVKDRRLIE
jgi:hypothetical protein